MNLYNVVFKGDTPSSSVVLIKAETQTKANKLAEDTIKHTGAFTVEKIDMKKPGVLILFGDTN